MDLSGAVASGFCHGAGQAMSAASPSDKHDYHGTREGECIGRRPDPAAHITRARAGRPGLGGGVTRQIIECRQGLRRVELMRERQARAGPVRPPLH